MKTKAASRKIRRALFDSSGEMRRISQRSAAKVSWIRISQARPAVTRPRLVSGASTRAKKGG